MFHQLRVVIAYEFEELQYGRSYIELLELDQLGEISGNIGLERTFEMAEVFPIRFRASLGSFYVAKLPLVPEDQNFFRPQEGRESLGYADLRCFVDDKQIKSFWF